MAISVTRKLFRANILTYGGFAKAAHDLGVTSQYLYLICSSSPKAKRPSAELAGKIEKLFRLPVLQWVERGRRLYHTKTVAL
jgi:hypothetical protein